MLGRLADQRSVQEPDLTGALASALEILTGPVDGAVISMRVLESSGAGSSESRYGADICGVVRIRHRGSDVTKGFLTQAKRAGKDGLRYTAAGLSQPILGSHWIYDGPTYLDPSGTVTVRTPSKKLVRQCSDMLAITPASFIWVYAREQIAVVSASAVHATRGKVKAEPATRLGTKRLSDFFLHVTQSYLGDRGIAAWDDQSLAMAARVRQARFGLLLSITDADLPESRVQT